MNLPYPSNLVVGTVLGSNLFIFGRAIQRQFARPSGMPVLMRLLSLTGLFCAVADLWWVFTSDSIPVWRMSIALTLCLVSLRIFLAAVKATADARLSLAFSTDQPQHLNCTGPYRRVRHPFYLAYLLTWIGAAGAVVQWPVWIPVIAMGGFYVWAARLEEVKFLSTSWAGQYRNYMRLAGMFIPRWPEPSPPTATNPPNLKGQTNESD